MHIMPPSCSSQVKPSFSLCKVYCVFFRLIDRLVSPYMLGQHHRCNASTCVICLRTCTGDPVLVSSPRWASSLNLGCDSTAIPLSQSNTNNSSPPRRRRPRDEYNDNIPKSKDVGSERPGCGQVVCRTCCFEHPQR